MRAPSGSGAQWFSKVCPNKRFATVLCNDNSARRRKQKRLYCYRRGGVLDANAGAAVASIVCLCKQREFAAALHCVLHCWCLFRAHVECRTGLCYAVEDVEDGAGLLEDDMAYPVFESQTSLLFAEDFCMLCKDYSKQCGEATGIVPYEGEKETVAEDWASLACNNAQPLLQRRAASTDL